jgi:hypothetical protein
MAEPEARMCSTQDRKIRSAPVRVEDSLERAVQDARQKTAALEADLRQSAGSGFDDPAERLLQEARHRLDTLERELGATAPGK